MWDLSVKIRIHRCKQIFVGAVPTALGSGNTGSAALGTHPLSSAAEVLHPFPEPPSVHVDAVTRVNC